MQNKALDKIIIGVEWIVRTNNKIRLRGFIWLGLFFLWWISMMALTLILPAALNSIYTTMHFTFSLETTAWLYNLFSVSVAILFPVYVICYGIIIAAHAVILWKKQEAFDEAAYEVQARNL